MTESDAAAGSSAADGNGRSGSDGSDEWWVTNQLATTRDTMMEKARFVQGQLTNEDVQHAVVTSTVGTIGYRHTHTPSPYHLDFAMCAMIMLPSPLYEIPVIDSSS